MPMVTHGDGNANRKRGKMKVINLILDAIFWTVIMFGGIVTLVWLGFTLLVATVGAYELLVLGALTAFMLWRLARWW